MESIKYPSWADRPPVIDEKDISETVTADVVVVGGGNAGVLAATAAAFAGASVSVIEQQARERLHMYGLADIGTLNSKWALDRGVPRIDETEFLAEWQHRTQNRSDPRLIRKFAYHSGEMLDWLLGLMSPMLSDRVSVSNYPAPFATYDGEVSGFRTWVGTCELHNWNEGVRQVIAQAEANGAKWYWENEAVVLATENGRVTACITKTKGERYVKYIGKKGVILATGDFGGNNKMMTALYQEFVAQYEALGLDTGKLTSAMGRSGIGQLMAVWAGGSIEPGPYACVYPTVMPAQGVDPNLSGWGGGFQGTSFMRVNQDGKRYSDEGIMGIYGILHRSWRMGPGPYFSVFDSKWPDYIQTQCHEHFMPYKNDLLWMERTKTQMGQVLALGKKGYSVGRGKEPYQWGANTLEELADHIGFKGETKKTFVAQVERYNQMCYQGKDEDYAKDPRLLMAIDKPPFFATKTVLKVPDTGLVGLNGVITDENQAVLGKDFRPIPGLFATGTCGGGKFFMQYSSIMAGLAVGTAMTFGMLAGRHVAGLEG